MTATTMYVEQYNAYPGNAGPGLLMNQIEPFVGARWPDANYGDSGRPYLGPRHSVYACPGYNRARGTFLNSRSPDGTLEVNVVSYGYNFLGGRTDGDGTELGLGGVRLGMSNGIEVVRALAENQVAKPTDMIAFGDASFDLLTAQPPLWGGDVYLDLPIYNPNHYNQAVRGLPTADLAVQAVAKRHGGRWNVGFCDGHIESLWVVKLFFLANSAVACRWNNDNQPHNEGWVPPPPP